MRAPANIRVDGQRTTRQDENPSSAIKLPKDHTQDKPVILAIKVLEMLWRSAEATLDRLGLSYLFPKLESHVGINVPMRVLGAFDEHMWR